MLLQEEARLREQWRACKADGDRRARADLIQRYQFLVRAVSSRIAARLPAHVDEGDLASYGIVGLINSVDRFDPSQNVKFETFAVKRIRGAIFDALRSNDWVPRSVRSRMREIDKARVKLAPELGHKPTSAEIASLLGVEEDVIEQTLTGVASSTFAALDEPAPSRGHSSEERVTLFDTVCDSNAPDPYDLCEAEVRKVRIGRAVEHLPEREQAVISLHYFERMTLREIGSRLHVTESRVSQLHTRAIARLRAPLSEFVA